MQYNHPAGQPNTDNYTNSHFSCESKMKHHAFSKMKHPSCKKKSVQMHDIPKDILTDNPSFPFSQLMKKSRGVYMCINGRKNNNVHGCSNRLIFDHVNINSIKQLYHRFVGVPTPRIHLHVR